MAAPGTAWALYPTLAAADALHTDAAWTEPACQSRRRALAAYMWALAERLDVPDAHQLVVAAALVCVQRLWSGWLAPSARDEEVVTAACLFLAAKANDAPLKLKRVAAAAQTTPETLVRAEFDALSVLAFETQVRLPHPLLPVLMRRLGMEPDQWPAVYARAWRLALACGHSAACVVWSARALAAATLHGALAHDQLGPWMAALEAWAREQGEDPAAVWRCLQTLK